MKFDKEWQHAISLLPAVQQARLTEAIRLYQRCDVIPSDLEPAQMMGFFFAKAVIDRRKRINARARERRRLRVLHGSPVPQSPSMRGYGGNAVYGKMLQLGEAVSETRDMRNPTMSEALRGACGSEPRGVVSGTRDMPAPVGPVSDDYPRRDPAYRRINSTSFPGQKVDNDPGLIEAWHELLLADRVFMQEMSSVHHLGIEHLENHLRDYDIFLVCSDRVSVDCLDDYRIQFRRYMTMTMLRLGRRRGRHQLG